MEAAGIPNPAHNPPHTARPPQPGSMEGHAPGQANRFEITHQQQETVFTPAEGAKTQWHIMFTAHRAGTQAAVTLADENYTATNVHDTISTLADELEAVAGHPLVTSQHQEVTYDSQRGAVRQMHVGVKSQPSGTEAHIVVPMDEYNAPHVIGKVEQLSNRIEGIHKLHGQQPPPPTTPAPQPEGSTRA